MTREEFDAIPVGGFLRCRDNENLYKKINKNQFVYVTPNRNRCLDESVINFGLKDDYWTSLEPVKL